MTNRIDAMIAPRALTAMELAQVLSPQLIVYAVAHRAFIHNATLNDDTRLEAAVVSASETALQGIVDDGARSVNEWLHDCEADREPRFYRKAALPEAVSGLCIAAASLIMFLQDSEVAGFLDQLTDRDPELLAKVIEATSTF